MTQSTLEQREETIRHSERERLWSALDQLLDRIHRPTLHETAIAIANEGRWFVGCDRLALVVRARRICRTIAVSGIDRIEPRSSLVRKLQSLAAEVLQTNEPLWETGQPSIRAPQIEHALEDYLSEGHARAIVVLPVQAPRFLQGADRSDSDATCDVIERNGREERPQAAIVLEWFTQDVLDEPERERIDCLERHGGRALVWALAAEKVPLVHVGRCLAKARWFTEARRLPAIGWALAAVLALFFSLGFVPADFEIAAEGELHPAERREIFAPADGVVESVLVEHGDDVTQGQPLLRLRSPALDLESARIQGEIQTAEKRLAAILAARLEADADPKAREGRALSLTAEEEEVKEALKSLRQQEQLLEGQLADLEIRSPQAGRILTWDVTRNWASRPVERGQPLLTLGNVSGLWLVELRVPEQQVGYVMDAAEQARRDGTSLVVSLALFAEPGVVYQGELDRIALRSAWDESRNKSHVLVTVRCIDIIDMPLPGATVTGKIRCGRRSLGFVWFHDAWNSIRRRLLF